MPALSWLLVLQMQFEDFAHFNVRQREMLQQEEVLTGAIST